MIDSHILICFLRAVSRLLLSSLILLFAFWTWQWPLRTIPRTPITNLAKNFRSSHHSSQRYLKTNLCLNWNLSSSSLRTFGNCSNFSPMINGVNVWISSPRRWKRLFYRHHHHRLHHLHISSMNSYASRHECRQTRTHQRAGEIHWPPFTWTILDCLEQYSTSVSASVCLSICLFCCSFILIAYRLICVLTSSNNHRKENGVDHIDVLVLALRQWRLDRSDRSSKLVIAVDKNAIGNDLLIGRVAPWNARLVRLCLSSWAGVEFIDRRKELPIKIWAIRGKQFLACDG